jgi:preprotein translocase subunit SecA
VETYNFDVRKRLIDYDDVMNKQREVIYARRDEIMDADNLGEIIQQMIDEMIDNRVAEHIDPRELPENWPLDEFLAGLEATFMFAFPPPEGDIEDLTDGILIDYARERAREAFAARERFLETELGSSEVVREFEKYVLLQTIDERWMDHLHELDYLKEGIHFRAYAQKDPLVEYKKEAFILFAELNETIDKDALHAFFHARIAARQQQRRDHLTAARATHEEAGVYAMQQPAMAATPATEGALREAGPKTPKVRSAEKVGRNDPCPCGSGKKYKKCCGRA